MSGRDPGDDIGAKIACVIGSRHVVAQKGRKAVHAEELSAQGV